MQTLAAKPPASRPIHAGRGGAPTVRNGRDVARNAVPGGQFRRSTVAPVVSRKSNIRVSGL